MGRCKRWPNERYISEFRQGVLYAASWLINAHDQPTLAEELLETDGMDRKFLIEIKKQLEKYDRDIFKKAGFFKFKN